ncbi:hypothetical protein ACKLNR_010069 [Fusarium oxysporum f. sp. zingiberi]
MGAKRLWEQTLSTEEKRANDICVSTKTESDSVVNGVKVRNRGRASPKLQVREPGTDVETVRSKQEFLM